MAVIKDAKNGVGIVSTLCDTCDHGKVCEYRSRFLAEVTVAEQECEGQIFGPKEWYCEEYTNIKHLSVDKDVRLTQEEMDVLSKVIDTHLTPDEVRAYYQAMEVNYDDTSRPQ